MLPVDQTPQGKRGAKADDEQIRPPMSAAVSPTGTPVPLTPQTPATATQQHPQALAPAVTPAREEPLEAIFARLDVSNDGQLDKTEVGQMLALLRAQATDAFADEEWLDEGNRRIEFLKFEEKKSFDCFSVLAFSGGSHPFPRRSIRQFPAWKANDHHLQHIQHASSQAYSVLSPLSATSSG